MMALINFLAATTQTQLVLFAKERLGPATHRLASSILREPWG
jgi:hypothetical protein